MHSAEEFRDDPGQAKEGNISKITAAMRPVIALGTAATLTLLLGVTPALIATAWGSRGAPAVKIAVQDHSAQNQKNNGKKPRDSSDGLTAALPDAQAIDLLVSQMLAAWQLGDLDEMHKYYDDNMAAVSGAWEPPLVGWSAYAAAYQKQHARTQGSRLDRTNTVTKVMGDAAWVTYQWDFSGQVDGQAAKAVGHTTLVLQKHAGSWMIVLNHTSVVPTSAPINPAAATNP